MHGASTRILCRAAQVVAALRVPAASVAAEAKVLLGLGLHPRLIQFIGMYREGEDAVLITEYAPLGSLDKHIEEVEDDITMDHKMVIISQVCACWPCTPLLSWCPAPRITDTGLSCRPVTRTQRQVDIDNFFGERGKKRLTTHGKLLM